MLDGVVGGAIAAGDGALSTMIKESGEEASLDADFIRSRARCTGLLSATRRRAFKGGHVVFPAVVFAYELEFEAPDSGAQVVQPRVNDRDEVGSFELMDEAAVVASLVRGEWAPWPALV